MEISKIDISQNRITEDALVVWNEPGEQVDMVVDPRELTFREGSIDQIISYHVLDQLFIEEAIKALANWTKCLKTGGKLIVMTDDFEYIARAFVGGDISLETFNRNHSHASQWDRQTLGETLISTGFVEGNVTVWFDSIKDVIDRQHWELLIQGIK